MLDLIKDGVPELDISIEKWRTISYFLRHGPIGAAFESEGGKSNCALCYFFWKDCESCPVFLRTGKYFCSRTPYEEWDWALEDYRDADEETVEQATANLLIAAEKEVEFLESLKEEV